MSATQVTKRNGRKETLDLEKLHRVVLKQLKELLVLVLVKLRLKVVYNFTVVLVVAIYKKHLSVPQLN